MCRRPCSLVCTGRVSIFCRNLKLLGLVVVVERRTGRGGVKLCVEGVSERLLAFLLAVCHLSFVPNIYTTLVFCFSAVEPHTETCINRRAVLHCTVLCCAMLLVVPENSFLTPCLSTYSCVRFQRRRRWRLKKNENNYVRPRQIKRLKCDARPCTRWDRCTAEGPPQLRRRPRRPRRRRLQRLQRRRRQRQRLLLQQQKHMQREG